MATSGLTFYGSMLDIVRVTWRL